MSACLACLRAWLLTWISHQALRGQFLAFPNLCSNCSLAWWGALCPGAGGGASPDLPPLTPMNWGAVGPPPALVSLLCKAGSGFCSPRRRPDRPYWLLPRAPSQANPCPPTGLQGPSREPDCRLKPARHTAAGGPLSSLHCLPLCAQRLPDTWSDELALLL